MTLDELSKAYYAAYWGVDTTNNNHRDIAGIRAVVAALRDELSMSKDINSCSACDENYDLFHEILASDGVEAAGTDTAVTETKPEAIERSAPAAAYCPSCLNPIKSEAAR
jgi:hypothetical protein